VDDLTRLALAAGDGDRQALASFVRASQGEVWRLCAHLVDRQSADDLTQEVYLRAVPALARFRGDSSARTWLLTIARRTCADALRRTIRQRRLSERLGALTTKEQLLTPGDAGSAGQELDGLVAGLDLDRRTAFVMTQLLGMSYAEVAQVCDVPVGTIRSRVSRARADLVAALGEGDLDVAAD
jgi:RNA polymerase sigma-70 factor (ECF subfamily)